MLIGLIVVLVLVVLLISTLKVVKADEAHVVVWPVGGRKIYMSREAEADESKTNGSFYFYIPFLCQRQILPLGNVKLDLHIPKLRDKNVAPFICTAVSYLSIVNPERVVEKLEWQDRNFKEAVQEMLEPQVQAIARAAAMEQEILDIMVNREEFSQKVKVQTNGSLKNWGLNIVGLEIVDFSDADNDSHVIEDYENKRKAEIEADARKTIAVQKQEAEVAEAENERKSGIAKQNAQREVEIATVSREQQVDIAKEQKTLEVAKQRQLANEQEINAKRTYDVGSAQVIKEALIVEAEGKKEAEIITAEGLSNAQLRVGEAEAKVIQLKGEGLAAAKQAEGLAQAKIVLETGRSEAEAQSKMADAKEKLTKASLPLEKVNAAERVEIAKANAMAKAWEKADIKINNVTGNGDSGGLLGFLNGQSGAGIAQMLEAFESVTGADVKGAVKELTSKEAKS